VWLFRRRHVAEPERWSPRGRWEAPIERLYDGIASVGVITFEDGSRWQGPDVAVPDGKTPEEAVEGTIQSLIDEGEFEFCLERLDQPAANEGPGAARPKPRWPDISKPDTRGG
jgi:hypothetical protein